MVNAHGSITSMPHLAAITNTPFDQMASADLGGGGDAYYQYDASGARIRKVIYTGANLIMERLYLGAYELYREHVSGSIEHERQSLHVLDGTRRVAVLETLTIEDGDPVTSPTTHQRYQLGNHLGSAKPFFGFQPSIDTYNVLDQHPKMVGGSEHIQDTLRMDGRTVRFRLERGF